jgi:amino acid adenylation domain-containing protein
VTDLAERVASLTPEERRRLQRRLEARLGAAVPPPVPRLPRGGDFPLSFAQERLWFLDQLAPGSAAYNLASAQRLPFALETAVLERALAELVRRHEALRTVFPLAGGEPVQRILAPGPVRCPVADAGALPPALRQAEAERVAAEAAREPFDLAAGPLFRARLVRLGAAEWVFVFVVHHVAADGSSLQLLFRELPRLYADAAAGRPFSLPEPPVQYADFAVWQREWLRGEVLEAQLAYWTRALDELPTLELPTDRPRPAVQRFRGAQLPLSLPPATVAAVHALAREADATPFMVLLTAFYLLLHHHTGQCDLPVGIPVANRGRPELEEVVGFFANSLVMRGDLLANPTFRAALARVRATALDAYGHQDLPFSRLVAELRPEHDLSRNPLFQVSFQLFSGAARDGGGAGVVLERGTAIFDLVLNLWEAGGEVRGAFEYDTDLFDRATVEALASRFRALVDAALAAPDTPVGVFPVLTAAERARLLEEWSGGAADEPGPALHFLVRRQASLTPRAPAVRQGSAVMSYAELDRAAARITRRLRCRGVGLERCVGVLLPPSLHLLPALLGVLRAGGAYVPLDPALPRERLAGMLADAGARWVLADAAGAEALAGTAVEVLRVDAPPDDGDDAADRASERPDDSPDRVPDEMPDELSTDAAAGPDALAYVLFTSGSTGRPKGVMVTHRGVSSYLAWCRGAYPVDEGEGAPLCSPVSSDMSVTSLFLPLLAGKTVFLLEEGDVVEALDAALRSGTRFSFVKLTPAHLEALRTLSLGRAAPAGTGAFVVGGEALHGGTLALWREQAPGVAVHNEYGPTETVVGCSVHALAAGEVDDAPVPIGRPAAGARLYLLDRYGSPVPPGVPGELYIGGAGVARGYAGAPGLTAGRFVPDPFSAAPGARLFRTGDRARHRADGTLEFLGRLDAQVKIRGHRIEPGEVEAALRRHSAVAEAAVVARDFGRGDRRLVAYVAPAADDGMDAGELAQALRPHLAATLPAWMVPSAFVRVDALPLTRSGKVDLRALEARFRGRAERAAPPVPPRTPLEALVARVFADVLKAPAVGARDGFFADLGGHSLLATRAMVRLRELLGAELALRTLFEAQTPEALAAVLGADPRVERTAELVLTVLDMSDEQVRTRLSAEAPPPADPMKEVTSCA